MAVPAGVMFRLVDQCLTHAGLVHDAVVFPIFLMNQVCCFLHAQPSFL